MIVTLCFKGGNTGLVGGSVPVLDEVVLSLSSMNKVLSLDEYSGVVECEAGCILQNLEEHLAKHVMNELCQCFEDS